MNRNVLQIFGIAPFTTKKLTRLSKSLHIAYAMVWYILYVTCLYFDMTRAQALTDSFQKICSLGKYHPFTFETKIFDAIFDDIVDYKNIQTVETFIIAGTF